jgi:hypothetical protein
MFIFSLYAYGEPRIARLKIKTELCVITKHYKGYDDKCKLP